MQRQNKYDASREILRNQWRGLKPLLKIAALGLGLALIIAIGFGFVLDRWEEPSPLPPPLKGMALGLFHKEDAYDYEKDLIELKHFGVNSILLMAPWYQKDIRSTLMEPRYEVSLENSTLEDHKLINIIRQAHQLDLKVLLLPYLRFDYRGQNDWRGILSPTDFDTWSKNYAKFILHYARIAQAHGVEYFSIGSELGSMEDKTPFWLDLIQRTRAVYSGKILYSANWDHYTHPEFWGSLDAIGVTAYNRLSEDTQPSLSELIRSWRKFQKEILKFLKKYPHKKIIFTEVGYFSQNGTSRDPWNYFHKDKLDLHEQALCYQAFIEVWNGVEPLEGVFWWVWYGEGGEKDKSYTPRGKPAGQILGRWYQRTP